MYGGDVDAIPANDYEECRKICNEVPHCKRWTYQTPFDGACYLKQSMEEGKTYLANEDVELCFKCKTGFGNSQKVKCSEIGKNQYTSIIVSYRIITLHEKRKNDNKYKPFQVLLTT